MPERIPNRPGLVYPAFMIISPRRNFIFVHIPKTGGTSLALALEDRAARDDILIGDTPKARRRRGRIRGAESAGRLWKHSTLADIEGLVTRDFIRGALVATLVRNPWDRMASLYHWLRAQRFENPMVERARALDFEGFVMDEAIGEAICRSPYGSYLRHGDGSAAEGLFIRLEHFARDAAPMWAHLGFDLALPHVNASDREADYRGLYSTESRARIGAICAEDIRRFGYEF